MVAASAALIIMPAEALGASIAIFLTNNCLWGTGDPLEAGVILAMYSFGAERFWMMST